MILWTKSLYFGEMCSNLEVLKDERESNIFNNSHVFLSIINPLGYFLPFDILSFIKMNTTDVNFEYQMNSFFLIC